MVGVGVGVGAGLALTPVDGAEQGEGVAVRSDQCHLQQAAHEGGGARGEERGAVLAQVLEAVEGGGEEGGIRDRLGLVQRLGDIAEI